MQPHTRRTRGSFGAAQRVFPGWGCRVPFLLQAEANRVDREPPDHEGQCAHPSGAGKLHPSQGTAWKTPAPWAEVPAVLSSPGLPHRASCPPLSPPQQVSQVDGDEEAETHGSAAQRQLGWAVRAARGRLLPSVPLLWQLLRTYVGSPGWSLLRHPHVAPDPLLALSSASHCPAGRWPWALLRELCRLPGIMPLSAGLSPRFLLKEDKSPINPPSK